MERARSRGQDSRLEIESRVSAGAPVRVPAAGTASSFDVQETLTAIARPRLSTSAGFDEVAADVRRRFEGLGYDTVELPFTFAPWVGRFALSIAALAYVFGIVITGVFLLSNAPRGAAVALLLGAAGAGATAIGAMRLTDRARRGRRQGMNRLFRPAGARPAYLLMAHLDSKSQLVPLSLRAPAIMVASAAWLVLLGMAFAMAVRPVGGGAVFLVAIAAVIAGTLLALSWAGNDSPGALDNASGVATLLGVAARERGAGDVAFLVTDAEELGLAGARHAARKIPPVHGVINIDGVDDIGHFWIVERSGWRRRGLTANIAAALLTAAAKLEVPAFRRRLPIGMLLDHIPVARAGIPALSLLRGAVRSLHRVHRPSDDPAHLRGTGVERAVELLCAALEELRAQQARPT